MNKNESKSQNSKTLSTIVPTHGSCLAHPNINLSCIEPGQTGYRYLCCLNNRKPDRNSDNHNGAARLITLAVKPPYRYFS